MGAGASVALVLAAREALVIVGYSLGQLSAGRIIELITRAGGKVICIGAAVPVEEGMAR
jgi:hypothetical protein